MKLSSPVALLSVLLPAFSLAFTVTSVARADSVQVAVAANFATPLKALADDFKTRTRHTLLISPEATGKLYAQIKNGAPYEVFLSADQLTPKRLAAEGDALGNTRFTYGIGKLVLWSANPGTIDARGEVLRTSDARHLAIANPKTAPYGTAAISVMEALGVYPRWQSRLVQGENIAQTFQFVGSGNAELGFVALSQVMSDGKITQGSAWIVDPTLYPPLKQDVILLERGENNPAALAFMDYLKSTPARQLIQQFGYGVE